MSEALSPGIPESVLNAVSMPDKVSSPLGELVFFDRLPDDATVTTRRPGEIEPHAG
ncbi:hypothetical protein [Catenulispora subtropica]|uniref:Uncharacterized protein n=1 Tax=Catenulispora subtropica TaxID=450798 RepID=A0ABN2SR70_9ACTN